MAVCLLAAWPRPEAWRGLCVPAAHLSPYLSPCSPWRGGVCVPAAHLSPSCFPRRQAPLDGLKWRTACRKPGGHGPCSPLPARPLRAEWEPRCGQLRGPQGELGAAPGTAHQATLPVPVRARRAGPLPVPVAPRQLQGLDSGLQAALSQWRERHAAGGPGPRPAGEHRVARRGLPRGRPHPAPSSPACLCQ